MADSLHRRVTAALAPFVSRGVLAGAVTLVASADEILAVNTVGSADLAAGKPMQPDTVFWIASQTKSITCTALMMLVDDGKLSVDDPIEMYLPEFAGLMVAVERDASHVLLRPPVHPITVREAMSHTAGLSFCSPVETPTLDALPLAVAVRSHPLCPLQFEPGTKYLYSNAGTNTIGRLIEVVSGQAYETFIQKRLLTPLGMTETTFWPSPEQVRRLARTYTPNAAQTGLEPMPVAQLKYPLWDRTTRYAMPAGGLFSTAADVARFCQMILKRGVFDGRRYVSEASVEQMTSKQTGPEIADPYGFGWGVQPGACLHGGAYFTEMKVDFARGLISVWLVQHCGFFGGGEESLAAFHQALTAAAQP